MDRRTLLKSAASAAVLATPSSWNVVSASARSDYRPRPGEPGWPTDEEWARLKDESQGPLIRPKLPFESCATSGSPQSCEAIFEALRNPYAIRDDPALTHSLGWVDAWLSKPSSYAVAAESAQDVAAAVRFAALHDLRLVVKGGGHSYHGTSTAADSLLIWTRRLDHIQLHDDFRPSGCVRGEGPAVTLGAGVVWQEAYHSVMHEGGRYVQGGGCATVGVAGLVSSGGFGSYSKGFGTAASHLIEAEVVTADGRIRIVNSCIEPDLFWALKGGGGSSFGVITRLTLRTHPRPCEVGVVRATITAQDAGAFFELIDLAMEFTGRHLLSPHWGEQLVFQDSRVLQVRLNFQGISSAQAAAIWNEFFTAVRLRAPRLSLSEVTIRSVPGSKRWDPDYLRSIPGAVLTDNRPGSPSSNIYGAGDSEQAGQFIHGYASIWLPAELLNASSRRRLVEALARSADRWQVSLHLNKGLAGASKPMLEAARNTATNPAVLDAFALAIIGAEERAAYPGVQGHEPQFAEARDAAAAVQAAAAPLRALVAAPASYVSESDFFERDWQRAFWGRNHSRLARIKHRYDPTGLFFAHHMVGSDRWSADGFLRVR
jgi:FAD/FMN-containing dehydrogenase